MHKIAQLWIRACKSEEPMKRCESVLRRFYCARGLSEREKVMSISCNLCNIVDKFCPMDTRKVITELGDPPHYLPDEREYYEKVFHMLINQIRNQKVVVFSKQGLTSPLRFRK